MRPERVAFHHPDRQQKPARWDRFKAGFQAVGVEPVEHENELDRGDLFVSWNRHASKNGFLNALERRGVRIVVAENGYVGNSDLRAIALDHHNGAGVWYSGDRDRWKSQGIKVEPWRTDGTHILLLPQRGIGEPGVASPLGWEHEAVHMLGKMTKRPIRIRRHPGNTKHPRPLADDLRGAWCAVTWGSGAALKAVCAGIPVFHALPKWVGRAGAFPFLGWTPIEEPWTGDRSEMLRMVSWAQWSLDEIERGDPWRFLLTPR